MFQWLTRLIHPSTKRPSTQLSENLSGTQQPIAQLLRQIPNAGHPEYPFLHKEYSPASRVPCKDFTGFIISQLQENDIGSIKILMNEIIRANPGVGIGDVNTNWIAKNVEEVIQADIAKYIHFHDKIAYTELKSMMIMASKNGDKGAFWIVDNKVPILFAHALCGFPMEVKPTIKSLVGKANAFIAKMKKETQNESSYWEDFPSFPSKVVVPVIPDNSCRQKLLALSIGARLHLFDAIAKKTGNLPQLTDYRTRNFGIAHSETTQEILESGLLVKTRESTALTKCFSKNELIEACQQYNAEYRKSWNKSKLLQALQDNAHEFVDEALEKLQVVRMNPEYEKDLLMFYQISQDIVPVYALLCFV